MSPRTVVAAMFFAAVCLTAPFAGAGRAGGSPPPPPPPPTPSPPAPVDYRAPVPGPVIDPFRPPANPYAAGNRGLDYRTRPGERVVAAAAGRVVFAGPVAGRSVVVVLHADGLRTSYTGLGTVAVRSGQDVAAGQTLGTATDRLQFGVRAGAAYLDPGVLIEASRPVHAHLVREDGR